MQKDVIQNFVFQNRFVRGSFVRLSESFQTIINQHHYPELLSTMLGEALLGVCLMAPNFKLSGKITLQFQGEGDLRLLSARVTSDFKIRGLVRAEPNLISTINLKHALADGQLTLTYEPEGGQSYQSIIPVEKTSIAQTLEDYFIRSEQLPTRFFLTSTAAAGAGMMFQLLPTANQETAYQDFEHCAIIDATLTPDELLTLDAETLVHRLFPEEDVRVFEAKAVEFGCSCSRERMSGGVLNLGKEEAYSVLEEQGMVEVICEFCSQSHQFHEPEVEALFHNGATGSHLND